MEGYLDWLWRATWTLLGLLVLFAACTVIMAGNPDTSSDPTANKEEEEPKKQEKGKAKEKGPSGRIGESLEAGDVTWTVTNARQADQLNSQFLEPKQGNFIIVDLAFTNNGSEPTTLSTQSISLLDSGGSESRPDPDTFGYIEPNRNIFLEQVNPGVSREGEAIFSVAPDASGFTLQLGDAQLFGGESAYVELGF